MDNKRRFELLGMPESAEFTRFDSLPVASLRLLIDEGFAELDDQQNEAPTLGEFLAFGDEREELGVTFMGYAVEPSRPDCRISIEGMYAYPKSMGDLNDLYQFCAAADESGYNGAEFYAWFD